MKCPRAVLFDLDNTLSRASEPLPPETAEKLGQLLSLIPVAVMSGASVERLHRDVVGSLPPEADLDRLTLFPDTGASCWAFEDGEWKLAYTHAFPEGESERVAKILDDGLRETGILEGAPLFGERILRRDAQVTLAAVGLDAPADLKAAWDPDRAKRAKLKAYLDPRLPGYDVRISSRTAIDITKSGIDKAHGVMQFAKRLGVTAPEMLFVGDDLGPGGNDAMVIPTGVETRQVDGPPHTAKLIDEILAACSA